MINKLKLNLKKLNLFTRGRIIGEKGCLKKMFGNPHPKMCVPENKSIPRIPSHRIPCTPREIKTHLQKYVDLIKAQGADDARIVRARAIPQGPPFF